MGKFQDLTKQLVNQKCISLCVNISFIVIIDWVGIVQYLSSFILFLARLSIFYNFHLHSVTSKPNIFLLELYNFHTLYNFQLLSFTSQPNFFGIIFCFSVFIFIHLVLAKLPPFITFCTIFIFIHSFLGLTFHFLRSLFVLQFLC